MPQPNFKIHIRIGENRAERKGFLRGIELGDVTVLPSLPGGEEEEAKEEGRGEQK